MPDEVSPSTPLSQRPVCVVGAGAMGRGIAQVALVAGHEVTLVDPDADQLRAAEADIVRRVSRKDPAAGRAVHNALTTVRDIADVVARPGTVVVEAVVENLDVKRSVLGKALKHFGSGCILATNTSSLSITEIAAGVAEPSRVAGMHFFNPVPAMRLVEVVTGLATDPDVADTIAELATAWGKSVARVRSAPGFIVNRVARPFYGEALKLVEEGAATIEVVDTVLRRAGGFRMGPFELMDLIGNDVNSEVTRTVWTAFHYDPRFQPSQYQRELVAAGRFGRKTGAGFYDSYPAERPDPEPETPAGDGVTSAVLRGESPQLQTLLDRSGVPYSREDTDGQPVVELPGLGLVALTGGRSASEESLLREAPVVVLDRCLDPGTASALAFATTDQALADGVVSLLAAAGVRAYRIADTPGLVVARVVSMIINEAWDATQKGVASAGDVDTAMTLGTNYPLGPFAWCERWAPRTVLELLDTLWDEYHDPRYRACQLLRAKVRADLAS